MDLTWTWMLMWHFLACGMIQNIYKIEGLLYSRWQGGNSVSHHSGGAHACLRVGGNRLPLSRFSQRKVAAMKANYTLGSAENNNKTHWSLTFYYLWTSLTGICAHIVTNSPVLCVIILCAVRGCIWVSCGSPRQRSWWGFIVIFLPTMKAEKQREERKGLMARAKNTVLAVSTLLSHCRVLY